MNAYVTAQEFLNHPTGLDVSNLIPGGGSASNQAELALLTVQASSYAEQIVNLPLYAHTVSLETKHVRPDPYGMLTVRCNHFPLIGVTSAQWRQSSAQSWTPINSQNVTIFGALSEGHKYVADGFGYGAYNGWGRPPLTVQTTYVAGYPNMALGAAVLAGATSLTVDTTIGVNAGDTIAVYDGANYETLSVASVTNATVLTLAAPTLYAHSVGVRVSELPPAVTVATIYLMAMLIKERRAGGGFVMNGEVQGLKDTKDTEDYELAYQNLRPFIRRVR